MRFAVVAIPLATACALLAATPSAQAGARQLHIGPTLGGFFTSGDHGALGGTVGAAAGYGLNDTFRVYGDLEYRLGADLAGVNTPHQAGSFAAGIAYTLDVVSVVPWIGVGGEAGFVASGGQVFFVPAAEARGGIDWLATRYFGLTFQLSYGFVLANRALVGDVITGSAGVRWTVDL